MHITPHYEEAEGDILSVTVDMDIRTLCDIELLMRIERYTAKHKMGENFNNEQRDLKRFLEAHEIIKHPRTHGSGKK